MYINIINKCKNIYDVLILKKIRIPKKIDVLLFCSDADRGVELNSLPYSPLIDSVRIDLENRGYKCITVAYPFCILTGKLAWGNPISLDWFYYKYKIINHLKKIFFNQKKNVFEEIFSNVILLSNAKLVIAIDAPAELSRSCHEKSINCVELLHGIGYAKIFPDWENREIKALPSHVLSLDPVSTETFSCLKPKGIEIFEIPHPFLKIFFNPLFNNKLPSEWALDFLKSRNKKVILYCFQWGYAGEDKIFDGILENTLYPKCLEDVIESTEHTVEWILRPHPVQLKNKRYINHLELIEKLCKTFNNCQWREYSKIPLPSILNNVDGCLTMNSMSAYEAAYFGVPSLLLCPTLRNGGFYRNMFEDLTAIGYASKKEATKENILNWIINLKRIKPLISNFDDEDALINALSSLMKREIS